MQKAEKRLNVILKKLKSSNIPNDKIQILEITKVLFNLNNAILKFNFLFNFALILTVLCVVLMLSSYIYTNECLLESPLDNTKIFREPEHCKICVDVKVVDKVKNISKNEFELKYSSKLRPVVVIDGTRDWSPTNSYECQFFPYKTEFKSLKEALNMSVARSRLEPGTESWYIGWSNCNDNAGKILRNYYKKPYFFPETSENIALSWIFMGAPGFGAHMHVDNVQYPSWQAQLSGRKKWRLVPPPECYYKCQEVQTIVNPGEIIVVDTNRWYHETFILPGDISITIGSEFD